MLNGSFQWLPLCLNLEQPCSFEILFGRNSCDGSEIRMSLRIDIERLRKFICTYAYTHTHRVSCLDYRTVFSAGSVKTPPK